MEVLLTGAAGRCGTAILEHLGRDHTYTCFDRTPPPDDRPLPDGTAIVEGDIADSAAVRAVAEGVDAIVHLAAYPATDGAWADVLEPNIVGTYAVLAAARDAGVDRVVFASSNHVMGRYEADHAPALYAPDYDLLLDHDDPVRPDSLYGVTKAFGEDLGRYFAETDGAPARFYALRLGSVRAPAYDHPYGDAERGVDRGRWAPDSDAYDRAVARMKATWLSRRDFASLVGCCLADESASFGIFSGVSDNRRRWFSLERARRVLGYDPVDTADAWDGPPA